MADETEQSPASEPEKEPEPETPASVAAPLGELADSLESLADKVEQTPAAEAQTEPSEFPPFALASAVSTPLEQLMTATRLQHDNLTLVQQRLEQHGDLFAEATSEVRHLMMELRDTLNLHQQVVGEFDHHVEALGLVTHAMAKIHRDVLKALGKDPLAHPIEAQTETSAS